jgi:predicted short-subunit dehydrogenase-like oxidoreductase (DUF2520 family)
MKLGVVGKGKAARSLVPILRSCGVDIVWWWSRGDGGRPEDLPQADVLLLAVSDRAITEVAKGLSQRPTASDEIWLHLSGFHPGSLCRVDMHLPKAAGCFHPLCALDGSAIEVSHVTGCVAGIDGDDEALVVAEDLAKKLGMETVHLTPGSKKIYHAAAVTVAGHVTALFDRASQALLHCGFDTELATRALHHLLQTAVENLEVKGPKDALTGPVARGDFEVTEAHIAALRTVDPELASLYEALSAIATELVDRA